MNRNQKIAYARAKASKQGYSVGRSLNGAWYIMRSGMKKCYYGYRYNSKVEALLAVLDIIENEEYEANFYDMFIP